MEANLYLELFHGRKDPKEEMDDWGSEGPVFGPLRYVHTTYGGHIKLCSTGSSDAMNEVFVLFLYEDMIYYDGVYYGDWSVFSGFLRSDGHTKRLTKFDESKTRPGVSA